jgi:hypothetical protein
LSCIWVTKVSDCYIWRRKPTRCYSIVYWSYNSLNMFRALICPSSGAREYVFVTVCKCCNIPHPGRITCHPAPACWLPATKALHTTLCNKSIFSSSWWWAYKCLKHVEQITRSINYWVASSWFSSPCITTMHGQTHVKFCVICNVSIQGGSGSDISVSEEKGGMKDRLTGMFKKSGSASRSSR